jgi:hypothetical protein
MKTYLIGAAVAAVLGCASANAQVLSGGLGGSVGGALSGGMRDTGVMTHGSGNGSFGTDLDAGSLRRNTSDITGRATNRVRNTADVARDKAHSTVSTVRDESAGVAGAASSQAQTAASATRNIDAATSAAGSLASTANANGGKASGALDATHDQQLLAPVDAPQMDRASVTNLAGTSAASSSVQQVASQGSPAAVPTAPTTGEPVKSGLLATKSVGGDTSGATPSEGATNTQAPLIAQGSGNASASKHGFSASGEANGSASASLQR